MTGLAEIRRALINPPAPEVRCSFFKAWDQAFATFPKGSYLAPLGKVPALIRPHRPTYVSVNEPERCWNGSWPRSFDPRKAASGRQNGVE